MQPDTVPLVRRWLQEKLFREGSSLRYLLSTRSESEALKALSDPVTLTEIMDFALAKMGHSADIITAKPFAEPAENTRGNMRRLKDARKLVRGPRGISKSEPEVG